MLTPNRVNFYFNLRRIIEDTHYGFLVETSVRSHEQGYFGLAMHNYRGTNNSLFSCILAIKKQITYPIWIRQSIQRNIMHSLNSSFGSRHELLKVKLYLSDYTP